MTLTPVDAISDSVVPVVLVSVGSLLVNGLLTTYHSINDRVRAMTRERIEILTGPAHEKLDAARLPAMDSERLHEIAVQLPILQRRYELTKYAMLAIYAAVSVLGLSIVVIAIAVTLGSEVAGRVALGFVLAGTLVMLAGLGVATMSLAKSSEAMTYAIERTQSLS